MAAFSVVEYRGDVSLEWRFLFVELNVIVQYFTLMLFPEGQTIFHAVAMSGPFRLRTVWSAAVIITLLVIAWRARARCGTRDVRSAVVSRAARPRHRSWSCSIAPSRWRNIVSISQAAGCFWSRGRPWNGRGGVALSRPGATRLMLQAVMVIAVLSLAGRTMLTQRGLVGPGRPLARVGRESPIIGCRISLLGEALHAAGRPDEAIAEYRRGIDLRPDQELAYQKLARAWLETGRAAQAWATFHELRGRMPQSPVASNGLGALALLGGDREGARAHFQQALAHDQQNVTGAPIAGSDCGDRTGRRPRGATIVRGDPATRAAHSRQ